MGLGFLLLCGVCDLTCEFPREGVAGYFVCGGFYVICLLIAVGFCFTDMICAALCRFGSSSRLDFAWIGCGIVVHWLSLLLVIYGWLS